MVVKDDRTDAQRKELTILIVGTDSFMSGWGEARGGKSVAAWACSHEHADRVEQWVRSRSDMRRVRRVYDSPRRYRPRGNVKHFHVYVVSENHPALHTEN